MAGVKTAYSGTFGILNATQVADEPFVSMGVVHTKDQGFEVYKHATKTTCRKLVFNPQGTRLIGALFIGDITNAGLYRYVIRGKMPVMHIKRYLIDHTLHYGYVMCGKL
jgi:nitrite reductase (NADH) large subunit